MKQSRRGFLVMAGAIVAAGAMPSPISAAGKMKSGIVGSGNVGSAIGATWIRAGHEVMFSSLDIEHYRSHAVDIPGHDLRAQLPHTARG